MYFRKSFLHPLCLLLLLTSWGQAQDTPMPRRDRTNTDSTSAPAPTAVYDNDPRLNVYRNIITYGAVGDGTTDNSVALQRAFDAGRAVLIPEGVFNFSATLTLRKDSLIMGVGRKSILRYIGTGVALREPEGSYTNGYDNLKLLNFTLTTTTPALTGIELTNNYQVTLSGLYIDGAFAGFKTAGIHILSANVAANSAVIRIVDGEIWGCVGDGIRVSGPAGAAGLWIERNHITGNAYGVNQITPTGAYPATNWQIVNNVIEGNLQGGIRADVLIASSITGNHFENSTNANQILVQIGSKGFAQGLKISNNTFGGQAAQYNIDLNSLADVTGLISGNMFAGASVAAVRAPIARGLRFENNILEPGTVPTLVTLGPLSRAVWIQDSNHASFTSGASSPAPNLTLGGRLIVGGASLNGGGSALETRTADGNSFAQHTALSFKHSAGPSWTSGAGAPAGGCVTGSFHTNTVGGLNTTLYVCEQGAWKAK
jgi:hypothetical protein